MTRFRPFPALRYSFATSPGDASAVVAPPYDVLSAADRRALEANDPRNSVRLDYPHGDETPDAYPGARRQLEAWLADGVLVRDGAPTLSVYRMTAPDESGTPRSTTGVIGGLGLEQPGTGDVLPHEETTSKDKADRLNLIRAARINTSPIWGLSLTAGLGAACAAVTSASAPLSVAVDEDGVRHEVWRVDDADTVARLCALVESTPVVIADGHHRFETGLAYLGERQAAGDPGEATGIMAFVVELADDQLEVRGIHRIVTLPDGTDAATALAPWFDVLPTGPVDAEVRRRMVDAGALCLVTRDGTHLLRPKESAFGPDIDLDSQRIRIALEAIPGSAVRYHHDVATVCGAVADGSASAGVLLRPATVAQIQAVAHARTRMPAKTTFFWPKPRTGVLFRPVD